MKIVSHSVSVYKPRAWMRWELVMLRGLFAVRPLHEIAALLERTPTSVKSRAKLLGIRKSNRKYGTPQEDARLRKLYPHQSSAELARQFGCSLFSVYQHAHFLELRKTGEYRALHGFQPGSTVGAAFRYPKGSVPANKGTRRPGYSPGRMAETQFKKGGLSGAARRLWLPVGSVVIDPDGCRKIKVADDRDAPSRFNWRFMHVKLWKEANGPVPADHVVVFKDGDKSHISLDNLELLSRAELMLRNTIHNLPPELVQVIVLNGALKRKIRNREKHAEKPDVGFARPPVRDAGVAEGSGQAAGH